MFDDDKLMQSDKIGILFLYQNWSCTIFRSALNSRDLNSRTQKWRYLLSFKFEHLTVIY